MPAHILFPLLAVLLVVAPAFAADREPKEPEVYATIPLDKKRSAHCAQFSPDGKQLAFIEGVLGVNKIVLWDVAKKERTAAFEAKDTYQEKVWSPDGKAIYAADLRTVYRIDVATGKRVELYKHDDKVSGEVSAIKYIPEKKQIVSAAEGGSIVVWDADKNKLVKKFKCPDDGLAVDLQPVPGTSKLAVTASLMTIHADDPEQVRHIRKVLFIADLTDFTFSTAVDPAPVQDDRRQLAAPHAGGEFAFADPSQGVVITDTATGKSRTIGDCPIFPLACRFSPSDRYLFVGGYYSKALYNRRGGYAIYDLTTEKWIASGETEGEAVLDMSYSPATNLLTCTSGAGADHQITVWDMKGIVDPAAKKEKKEKK